jgi:hypothetical protein
MYFLAEYSNINHQKTNPLGMCHRHSFGAYGINLKRPQEHRRGQAPCAKGNRSFLERTVPLRKRGAG